MLNVVQHSMSLMGKSGESTAQAHTMKSHEYSHKYSSIQVRKMVNNSVLTQSLYSRLHVQGTLQNVLPLQERPS